MKLDELPLYANDKELAEAVLGPTRAKAWPMLVKLFEPRGFPPIDCLTGGRYVPGVRQFLDAINGVTTMAPAKDGEELDQWHRNKRAIAQD